MCPKSSNKRYDENGDHPYKKHLKDLIHFLKDNDAQVKVLNNKYGAGQKLSINELIQDACDDIDNTEDLYEFTGSKKPVKSTLTRKNAIRQRQMSVIEEVRFYFIGEKPGDKEGDSIHGSRIQKGDIYIKETDTNFTHGADLLDVYSDLATNLNTSVAEELSSLDGIKISLKLAGYMPTLPFNVLHRKVADYVYNLDNEADKLETSLQELAEDYKAAFEQESKEVVNRFTRKLLVGSSRFSIFYPAPECNGDSNNENVVNKEEFLDKERYLRIKLIEEELKEMPVNKWPKGVLKLIILVYIEYRKAHSILAHIAKEEVENQIKLRILYSSFETNDLHVDDREITIKEFSKLLPKYKIDSDIDIFSFEAGKILEGPVQKLPDPFFKDQYIHWKEIAHHVTVNLRLHLFKKLARHAGLHNPDIEFAKGELDDYWPDKQYSGIDVSSGLARSIHLQELRL